MMTQVQTEFWQAPAICPVMGGFMAESVSIQYDFYIIIAICGIIITMVLSIPFMKVSYAPVIRHHHENVGVDLEESSEHLSLTAGRMGKWAYLWINLK
jgi:hypothetical protein